jgi:uncharacterized protein (TIGR02118 family)
VKKGGPDYGGTKPFNVTGHPALAVPAGTADEDLPLSVQVVERHFSAGEGMGGPCPASLAAGGRRTKMLKIVILMKKKAGMNRDEFISHYENSHAPLGRKYLGHLFRRYVRNYPRTPLDLEGAASEGETFDCITEIWLDDEAALDEMTRIIAQPEVHEALRRDEILFQDKSQSRFLIVDEREG